MVEAPRGPRRPRRVPQLRGSPSSDVDETPRGPRCHFKPKGSDQKCGFLAPEGDVRRGGSGLLVRDRSSRIHQNQRGLVGRFECIGER